MSTNYEQLETKAGEVTTAIGDLRTKTVALDLACSELAQAEGNAARTEAEYLRRKDQSDAAADDLAAVTALETDLRARRTTLQGRWDTLFHLVMTPDGTYVTAVSDKEDEIGADESSGKRLEIANAELAAQGHRTAIENANIAIVGLRAQEEQIEAEVASHEALVAELKHQRDSYPVGSAEYIALDGQVTDAIGNDTTPNTLEGEKKALADKRAEIAAQQLIISTNTPLLAEDVALVAEKIAELRVLETELATAQKTLDDAVAEFTTAVNQLQDIDGTSDSRVNTTLKNADADGAAGSQLAVTVATKAELTTIDGAYDTAEAAAKIPRDTAAAALPGAQSAKTTAQSQYDIAQTTLERVEADLRVLVDKQKDIEVRAAAALLEDFLKNEDAVLAAAPTVALAVQQEVDKTCPSSKVNELVSQFRAAYADEDEYKALLERIIENPFAVFFNQIEDPCFVLLTEAEVAQFRADVEERFRAEARRLLREYGHGGSTSSGVSIWFVVAVIVVIVAVLGLAFFLSQ